MISSRKDRSIAAFIQELNQHIRRQENQMCAGMIYLKKAMPKITELEEELKATREDYEEEIEVLVDKNADLTMKIGIFMGGPMLIEEDEEPKEIRPENYIIIDDTDSGPDDSDDDYVDEARAGIMESLTDQFL